MPRKRNCFAARHSSRSHPCLLLSALVLALALQPLSAFSTPNKSPWIDINGIESLKRSIDIISVIESFNLEQFHRQGNDRAIAQCPFHDDHSPSLNIDGKRGIYKCFACGNGGDVFRFVVEYNRLQGKQLTFYQAVRQVVNENGGAGGQAMMLNNAPTSPKVLSEEELAQIQKRKDRILLANAAAAAFYADRLTMPNAGGARLYARNRGLTPACVRKFALGYAPDSYFGAGGSTLPWGAGSLVQHLRDLEFSPDEIVDAGLAVRCKTAANDDIVNETTIADTSNETSPETTTNSTITHDYDSLMDRFRGRLMVPILDSVGSRVVAFGGRILPGFETSNGDFTPPKYLNSPETLVFSKQNILFGESLAREALRNAEQPSVVMVEGYMDAMTLWAIGIRNVVSCMGAAVSKQQLSLAARLVGNHGRVVLCLDNDQAGKAAVERLCTNGMVQDLVANQAVDVRVAALPDAVKDPAEFIEFIANGGSETAGVSPRSKKKLKEDEATQRVQQHLFDSSLNWIDWYMKQVINEYDCEAESGQAGSIGNIFDRLADFMAASMTPEDRIHYSKQVASSLASILAKDGDSSTAESVQSQLETDLIDLTSRMASTRDAVQRRSEEASGGQITKKLDTRTLLSSLSRGEGPSGIETEIVSSGRVFRNKTSTAFERRVSRPKKPQSKRRMFRRREQSSEEKAMTPHFSGFTFKHKADRAWLGLQEGGRSRYSLVLGQDEMDKRAFRARERFRPVYFNSNGCHGHRFLTDDARDAGYQSEGLVGLDASFLNKGVSSLLEQDVDSFLQNAEDSLLRLLVQQASTRTCLKNIIEARRAVGSDVTLEWSSVLKSWLFDRLVHVSDDIPPSIHSVNELRSFLSALQDCPSGAFFEHGDADSGNLTLARSVNATLDSYFDELQDETLRSLEESMLKDQRRCELTAQQLLSSLLMGVTARQARIIRSRLESTAYRRLELQKNVSAAESATTDSIELNNLLDEEKELVRLASDVGRELQVMSESSRRLSKRLIDEAVMTDVEGHISLGLQAELSSRLDDFVEEVLRKQTDGEGRREMDEAIEDALERIEREFGEWSDAEYVWTCPEPQPFSKLKQTLSYSNKMPWDLLYEEDQEEDLEVALERISREWAGWEDDN